MLPRVEHPKNSITSLIIKCDKDSVQLTVGRREDNTVRPKAVPGIERMPATSSPPADEPSGGSSTIDRGKETFRGWQGLEVCDRTDDANHHRA